MGLAGSAGVRTVKWFVLFIAILVAFMLGALTLVIVREAQGVDCHERVRKSDPCWKDLNTRVDNLEIRITQLEDK